MNRVIAPNKTTTISPMLRSLQLLVIADKEVQVRLELSVINRGVYIHYSDVLLYSQVGRGVDKTCRMYLRNVCTH